MVKIVNKRPLGQQKVYDIGVEKDHNFLLKNGLIASNCFNKSHSTAYAYITYQTAYLKANYPVEYMSALLSASSDSQDKVEKYRENCFNMGIEVIPPNINISQRDFTPQGEQIIFGLSAVKNLGESAIENILQAREEAGGKFANFGDFIARVNLKIVNRRALETLIYAGAFDVLNSNRRQLIEGLDLMIAWTQKKHQEKETGQLNMFETIATNPTESTEKISFANIPSLPLVEDYSIQDKLKSEKEYLGFYVSQHPLKPVQESAKLLSPINLSELPQQKKKKRICVVGMITNIKTHIDKKNNNMAFLNIEDISGRTDAIIFASNYHQVSHNLVEDTPVIIWGKADTKEDKTQIIVDLIEPIEMVKMVLINLTPDWASDPKKQGQLKGILQEQSGDKNKAKIPIIAVVNGATERIFVRFADNYWVQSADNTVEALKIAGFHAYVQSLKP
jgi:DNA polymerase-3 subunit alpha